MDGCPSHRSSVGRRFARARRAGRFGAAAAVLAFLASLAAPHAAHPALPDLSWKGGAHPVCGTFNRDEPSPVRLTIRTEGRMYEIPVGWRLFRGEAEIAAGDTLVPAAARSSETVLALILPPLDPGKYTLRVTADPAGMIEEKDEGNNTSSHAISIPNGKPVRFRCEGPEGSTWEIYRVELSTAAGRPYPDSYGTRVDTTRSSRYETVVNGVEPGDYIGIFFGPSVNRIPVLVSQGSFTMPDPPREIEVVWQRTTPYLVGRPRIRGDALVGVGGESGAPRWRSHQRYTLDGTIRNPTDIAGEVRWVLRFVDPRGTTGAEKDTTLYLGALVTEGIFLTGRIPPMPGSFLMQAEVRVPWPMGFEDLGDGERAAAFVLPLGWIEVER